MTIKVVFDKTKTCDSAAFDCPPQILCDSSMRKLHVFVPFRNKSLSRTHNLRHPALLLMRKALGSSKLGGEFYSLKIRYVCCLLGTIDRVRGEKRPQARSHDPVSLSSVIARVNAPIHYLRWSGSPHLGCSRVRNLYLQNVKRSPIEAVADASTPPLQS